MDPFGMSPEQYAAAATWVAALAAVATLGVVFVTALYAKGQLDEARRLRLAQTRPYVVVSIGVEQQTLFMLLIENTGRVPAQNIRVEFDDSPQSSIRGFEGLRLLTEPIPTMAPGQIHRAYWESSLEVFSTEKPYPYPMSYGVAVTYEANDGQHFGPERYILDFRVYEGQAAGPKGLTELIKAVENIQKQQKNWQREGLLVRTRNDDKSRRRDQRPRVVSEARQRQQAKGWIGLLRYLVEHFRREHGLHDFGQQP